MNCVLKKSTIVIFQMLWIGEQYQKTLFLIHSNTVLLRSIIKKPCPRNAKQTPKAHCDCAQSALTVQAIVLLVGAFTQDGGGAIVEDGSGLYGSQAACRDGASTKRQVWFGWTGMCFCGHQTAEKVT